MPKLLVVAFGRDSLLYVRRSRLMGFRVRVLNCVDSWRNKLSQWFGDELLHVGGHRQEVCDAVAAEAFDIAIVHEDTNFVKTALITQALRDAGVKTIVVVTTETTRKSLYRRCGANVVLVAPSSEQAWPRLSSLLPTLESA